MSTAPRHAPPPLVGTSLPRHDGLPKACGSLRYSFDELPPGTLYAGAKRADFGPARLDAVDCARARALPGVVAVLTAADVPGTNRQGIVHKDQPVLAADLVRHAGEAVALVLAESRQALAQALAAVDIRLTPLPGVHDPLLALKPGAPLVHEGHPQGNLLLEGLVEKGDARAALAACQTVVDVELSTPMQEHVCLEPPNAVAWVGPGGRLNMTVSTQAPFRDRFEIGQALGLDPWRIRIKAPPLGGGFGGKDGSTVQCLCALAALFAKGRPVKMAWDREETFVAGYKRHAARLFYSLGADAQGRLQALVCRLVYDSGAYAHLGGEIMALGLEHAAGPYFIPHTRIEGQCVYTHNPVAGAFRGFGVAQAAFGIERAMDALADKLGLCPLALRRENALQPGQSNGTGNVPRGDKGVAQCLELLSAHPLWTGRRDFVRRAGPFKRRGVGVAACLNAMGYGRGLPDAAIAKLELQKNGRLRIYSSVPDMGQGNASAFVHLAAAALNQDPAAIDLVCPDTARCHPSGSASASRTTYTFGNALLAACRAMEEKLKVRAGLALFYDEPSSLRLAPGLVRCPETDKAVSLAVLGAMLPRDDRICVGEFAMDVVQNPAPTGKSFRLGFPHLFFSHGAMLAAVEVDELTGAVRVLETAVAVEAGRLLNPLGARQQIHGALAQGLGYALMEDAGPDPAGRPAKTGLAAYLIPTIQDMPGMDCLFVDSEEPSGPYGLKGLGEVAMHLPGPAVAQAVEQALGRTLVTRLPLTPQTVLHGLDSPKDEPA